MEEKETAPPRTPEQKTAEQAFLRAGHRPENMCDHSHWSLQNYGRVCSCGTCMVDFGD
jgi:hypothetical protein